MAMVVADAAVAQSPFEPPSAAISAVFADDQAYPQTGNVTRVASLDQDNPFNSLVGKKRVRVRRDQSTGGVQRFVLSGGTQAFLFQIVGDRAYIQFQCGAKDPRIDCQIDPSSNAPEIHVLVPVRAARGDIIYKNRQGETVLRMASYGGATVWWPHAKTAQAASRSYSDLNRLDHGPASTPMVINRAKRASAILSAMTGEPIIFDSGLAEVIETIQPAPALNSPPNSAPTENPDRESIQPAVVRETDRRSAGRSSGRQKRREARRTRDAVKTNAGNGAIVDGHLDAAGIAILPDRRRHLDGLADAIVVTAVGIGQVAADATGARVIANRISLVTFEAMPVAKPKARSETTRKAAVSLDKTVLTVRYWPGMPLDRRLSSADVARFLEDNL